MRGVRDVEVDAGQIRVVARVLMTLEEKAPAVIVALRRTTGVVIVEDQVRVLIRLGLRAVAEQTEIRDGARRILERVRALRDPGAKRNCWRWRWPENSDGVLGICRRGIVDGEIAMALCDANRRERQGDQCACRESSAMMSTCVHAAS